MKVLVTGGSGFIGAEVVSSLLAKGVTVANFDVRPPAEQRQRSIWLGGDLLDFSRVKLCINEFQPDAVVHLAAKADITSTRWENFSSIHAGTANVLAAVDTAPSVRRFVNISTQLVIGPGEPVRSLLDFRPYTTYGEAKAHAERLLLQWDTSVHWTTVRPANIWGPEHPTFAEAIWKYIRKRVYLHPSGKPVFRSYGFVGNTANQIIGLLHADPERVSRRILYAADGVLDSAIWADAFSEALTGKPARRVPASVLRALGVIGDVLSHGSLPAPINSGRVMRMTQSYPVPLDEILALTGDPKISLLEGVRRTVAWLRTSHRAYRQDP